MNIYNQKESSSNFQNAVDMLKVGLYAKAIPLFEEDFQIDKTNFAALNNIAWAKINLAIAQKNYIQLIEAIGILKTADYIVSEIYQISQGYDIAKGNIIWAKNLLKKFLNNASATN